MLFVYMFILTCSRHSCNHIIYKLPHSPANWKPRNRPTPSGKSTSQPPHGSPRIRNASQAFPAQCPATPSSAWNLVSLGTLTESIAHPREVTSRRLGLKTLSGCASNNEERLPGLSRLGGELRLSIGGWHAEADA